MGDPDYIFNEMCGRCVHEGRNLLNEQVCGLKPHDYRTDEQREIVRWLTQNFRRRSPVTGPCPSYVTSK